MIDAALGELPGVAATHTTSPQDLPVVVRYYYANISPEAFGIYHTTMPI